MLKEIFLQKLRTKSQTVNNAIITLGDTDDSGKGKKFKSRFIQPGLAGYPGQYGNVLVRKETLDNSINTIIGAPVIINHKNITDDNAKDERVGVISNVWYNDKDGWYWCEGVIWDETAQNLITDKGWSVSCSYDYLEENNEGGTENNIPYDREFTKLNFVHLALVDNPRYERANIVFNSKTVINNKFKEEEHPRDENGQFTSGGGDETEKFNKEIDKIKAGKYPRGKQVTVIEKPSQPWLDAGLQDKKMVMPVAVYYKATEEKHNVDEETIRKFPELLGDPPFIFKSSTEEDSFVGVLDATEKDGDTEKPLIVAVKPVQDRVEVNIITSTYGKDTDFIRRETEKGNLLYKRKKTISNSIVASIATETLKPSTNIITNSSQDLKPDYRNIKEHEEMTLLEELKKLITKVENDKGENMDDEKKIENEKVDKRKLIDEIGGILKGKVDEELWRTVIGKAEKIADEKSEAGTSDNSEQDPKKEEKPADNKKVKNEDEESKEEFKELKKEMKEDTENKKSCNNSVENAKPDYFEKMNQIYNSAKTEPQTLKTYVSRAERLEAGNKY